MTSHIRELFERILSIFRKRELDNDFNEELASHIEMATEENIRAGMNPREARRQALIRFGGIDAARELHRCARGLPLIENIALDVRYAFRMFFKNPGFSLAVIITLALCIGANTAIFSMLDALVIKPLPFNDADRIVSIYTQDENDPDDSIILGGTIPQYLDYKKNIDGFSYLALFGTKESNLGIGNNAIRSYGAVATAEIFDVLDLNPVIGRFFSKENIEDPDRREIVLTQSFWKSYFQEDPGILGSTIQVDGEAYEVIGVAPKTFEAFNAQPRFIVSMHWMPWLLNNNIRVYVGFLLGRLKPDAVMDVVSARMTALEHQTLSNAPPHHQEDHSPDKISIGMDTLQSIRIDTDLRLKLYLLQGAVLFVLLIGCVNVVNLFLSRANARQGELAVRIALGAGQRAIARQLFVESFLLTWIGTAFGIVLAFFIIDIINIFTAQLLPKSLPFLIDGRMLVFTAIIATLTSLGIGLFQVFHVSGSNLLTLAQNQSQRVSSSRSLRSMSGMLIIAQMAITLVLLIGGGLMIHSFANLVSIDPGFNPQHLVTANIALSPDYQRDNRDQKFRQQLEESLSEIPGFSSTSLCSSIPYNGGPSFRGLQGIEEYPDDRSMPRAFFYKVDSSYLETMQIPLIEGRWFNTGDTGDSRPVCVVSQDFARQYFSGRSALGKHISDYGGIPKENWPEIIGVVGSVRDLRYEVRGGRSTLNAIYYLLVQQQKRESLFGSGFSVFISVAIRSPRPAPEVIALLREKVKEIDPALPLYETGAMESFISNSFNERRMIMLLLCSFASIALILSAVGIYGVLAYDVSKRTHEIGIRGAIGATEKQITYMVLRQGLWKAGLGLLIGMTGAFYLCKFMTSLLFEVKPIDPLTFILVPLLLLAVAVLASYIPARHASRVEPVSALRVE